MKNEKASYRKSEEQFAWYAVRVAFDGLKTFGDMEDVKSRYREACRMCFEYFDGSRDYEEYKNYEEEEGVDENPSFGGCLFGAVADLEEMRISKQEWECIETYAEAVVNHYKLNPRWKYKGGRIVKKEKKEIIRYVEKMGFVITTEVRDRTAQTQVGNPYGLFPGEWEKSSNATRWLTVISDIPDGVAPEEVKKRYDATTDCRLMLAKPAISAPVPYASLGAGKIIR